MKDVEAFVELIRIGTRDDKGMIKRIVGDPLRAAPIKPWDRLTRCARRVLRHVLKETARLLDSPRRRTRHHSRLEQEVVDTSLAGTFLINDKGLARLVNAFDKDLQRLPPLARVPAEERGGARSRTGAPSGRPRGFSEAREDASARVQPRRAARRARERWSGVRAAVPHRSPFS